MTSTVTAKASANGQSITYNQKSQYSDTKYGITLIVVETGGMSFQCCGSRTAWHMSGYFGTLNDTTTKYGRHWEDNKEVPGPDDAELFDLKADFVCAYLNTTGVPYTLYGIATTSQMKLYRPNKRMMLHLLLEELGAVIIDERPNMVHGPNMMCMIAWCPKSNMKLVNKYAVMNPKTYSGQYIPAPNPFRKTEVPKVVTEVGVNKAPSITDKQLDQMLQTDFPFGPYKLATVRNESPRLALLRDAQGRFTKRVS